MEFEAGFKPGAVTFDQSGKYLAVGGSDIRTYAVKGFVHLNTMTDHAKAVTALVCCWVAWCVPFSTSSGGGGGGYTHGVAPP